MVFAGRDQRTSISKWVLYVYIGVTLTADSRRRYRNRARFGSALLRSFQDARESSGAWDTNVVDSYQDSRISDMIDYL